jgi:cytochrome c
LTPFVVGLALLVLGPLSVAAQDLRGHGGPVRALAVGDDGGIYSGSFDTRAIAWAGTIARQVTRHHDGAVTAVLPLQDGRFASGGQDGRVAIWGDGPEPLTSETRHPMPVAALAPWSGGLASAGWDGTIVLSSASGANTVISAHDGQITGMVAYRGGLASTGADLRLRLWDVAGQPAGQFDLDAPVSGLATDGEALFLAAPDGRVLRIDPGAEKTAVDLSARPLLSVAYGRGAVVAGSTTGEVWILDPGTLEPRVTLQTGQGPIWAVAVADDVVLTGGTDGLIRRWRMDGTPLGEGAGTPDPTLTSPRGAEVFRACAVCHTLTPEDGARAGPTLHGIFGRPIATAEGFDYSAALRDLDIVWTPQTVSELFEFGPETYTPGSRMPEQRIPSAADRQALIEFLQVASR